jgi:hypothetical protein
MNTCSRPTAPRRLRDFTMKPSAWGLRRSFGPDVNIANVAHDDVLDLEATRNGLGAAGPFSSQKPGAWAGAETAFAFARTSN